MGNHPYGGHEPRRDGPVGSTPGHAPRPRGARTGRGSVTLALLMHRSIYLLALLTLDLLHSYLLSYAVGYGRGSENITRLLIFFGRASPRFASPDRIASRFTLGFAFRQRELAAACGRRSAV